MVEQSRFLNNIRENNKIILPHRYLNARISIAKQFEWIVIQ